MTNLPREGIGLLLSDKKYVKLPLHSTDGLRTRVQKNDILISITAELGKIGFVEADLGEAYVNQHIALIRIGNSSVDPKYLAFFLASNGKRIQLNRLNDAGAKSGLSLQTISKFPIALPPLPEQRAIADLLSTWDTAIEKMERMIAAKERRFQGLLRRLIQEPSEKWEENGWRRVTLGEVCDLTMGSSPPSSAYNKDNIGLPFLQGKADLKYRKSNPRIYTAIITKKCEVGDILISVRAPVGYISRANHACCIGRGIAAIKVKEECDTDFIFFQLLMLENNWQSVAQGGTFDAITGNELSNFIISIPKLGVQRELASILSASQYEINLLKQLLEKYKTQKRGLMEKLLTGKWRVKAAAVKRYEGSVT